MKYKYEVIKSNPIVELLPNYFVEITPELKAKLENRLQEIKEIDLSTTNNINEIITVLGLIGLRTDKSTAVNLAKQTYKKPHNQYPIPRQKKGNKYIK